MITLALTGDVMLGRGVAEAIDRRLLRPEELWGDVIPLLDAADLRIINLLECPLTDYEQRWTRTPKRPHFRPHPRLSRLCGLPRSTPVRWPTTTLWTSRNRACSTLCCGRGR